MAFYKPMEVDQCITRRRQTRLMSKRQKVIDAIAAKNLAKVLEYIIDENYKLTDLPAVNKFNLLSLLINNGQILTVKKLYDCKGSDIISAIVNTHGESDAHKKMMHIVDILWKLIVPCVQNFDMIEELLKLRLIKIDQQVYENGPTLLLRAIENGRVDVVRLLLSLGADVNNQSSFTPVFLASISQSSTIAEILIEHGAKVHLDCNKYKLKPLHIACAKGSYHTLHLLLHHGADINDVDRGGRVPFFHLLRWKSSNFLCIQIMMEHIAKLASQKAYVHRNNFLLIERYPRIEVYYKRCSSELSIMKEITLHENIRFHTILTVDLKKLEIYVKNDEFVKNFQIMFKKHSKPIYGDEMFARLKYAEKKSNAKIEEFDKLNKIFKNILPNLVIEKISLYSCNSKLRCLEARLQTEIRHKKELNWPLEFLK